MRMYENVSRDAVANKSEPAIYRYKKKDSFKYFWPVTIAYILGLGYAIYRACAV